MKSLAVIIVFISTILNSYSQSRVNPDRQHRYPLRIVFFSFELNGKEEYCYRLAKETESPQEISENGKEYLKSKGAKRVDFWYGDLNDYYLCIGSLRKKKDNSVEIWIPGFGYSEQEAAKNARSKLSSIPPGDKWDELITLIVENYALKFMYNSSIKE